MSTQPIRISEHWREEYIGESDPMKRNTRINEEDRKALQTRRRIEDIKEASRLERDVLEEVWDL